MPTAPDVITDTDQPAKSWFQQIAAWGLANTLNSNTALTNLQIAKAGGKVEPIPFGNISLTQSPSAPAPAKASSPLMAAGLGGGLLAAGLGLAKLMTPAAAVVAPLAPVAPIVEKTEEAIPLIIDWEIKNGGQPGT